MRARCLPSELWLRRFLNAAETAIVTLSTTADFIASVAEFVRSKCRLTPTQKPSSPPAKDPLKELHTKLRENVAPTSIQIAGDEK
jgi:hypothetical protein